MNTVLTKTYPNGHTRILTVTAVVYGEDPTTAILTTVEDGAVSVSQTDEPDIWAQLQSQSEG